MGVVAPTRKLEREKEHGVIRPMSTMEKWAMSAQEAYASKDPMKRLEVVPDIGPGITAKVPTRFGHLMRDIRGSEKPFKEVIEPILELKEAFLGGDPRKSASLASVNYGDIGKFLEEGKKLKISTDATGGFASLSENQRRQLLSHEVGHAMYAALTEGQKARMEALGIHSQEDLATGFVAWLAKMHVKPGQAPSSAAKKVIKAKEFIEEIWQGLGPKVNRGDRVGPIVNDKLLPAARKEPISPTAVHPFELQQLGLSKGAPPHKMGKKTTLSPTSSTRTKRGGAK